MPSPNGRCGLKEACASMLAWRGRGPRAVPLVLCAYPSSASLGIGGRALRVGSGVQAGCGVFGGGRGYANLLYGDLLSRSSGSRQVRTSQDHYYI